MIQLSSQPFTPGSFAADKRVAEVDAVEGAKAEDPAWAQALEGEGPLALAAPMEAQAVPTGALALLLQALQLPVMLVGDPMATPTQGGLGADANATALPQRGGFAGPAAPALMAPSGIGGPVLNTQAVALSAPVAQSSAARPGSAPVPDLASGKPSSPATAFGPSGSKAASADPETPAIRPGAVGSKAVAAPLSLSTFGAPEPSAQPPAAKALPALRLRLAQAGSGVGLAPEAPMPSAAVAQLPMQSAPSRGVFDNAAVITPSALRALPELTRRALPVPLGQSVDLQVPNERLGKLVLRLSESEGRLQMTLVAPRGQAREALLAAQERIGAIFKEEGQPLAAIHVELGGGGQFASSNPGQGQGREQEAPRPRAAAAPVGQEDYEEALWQAK